MKDTMMETTFGFANTSDTFSFCFFIVPYEHGWPRSASYVAPLIVRPANSRFIGLSFCGVSQ